MIRTVTKAFGASLVALFLSNAAMAAAPDILEPESTAAPADYTLDTVLVVHNWVLCVTEASAKALARAREDGAEAAAQAYADLAAAKTCGRFAKLGVMLKTPIYRTAPGRDYEARVFAALVNVGAGWQNAFVVAGLPD